MNLHRRALLGSLGAAGAMPGLLGASGAFGAPIERPAAVRARVDLPDDRVLRPAVPDTFFSFNLNSDTLDADHWDPGLQAFKPGLVEAMRAFPGAFYRYPGGNVANHLAWEWAVGPANGRRPQWAPDGPAPRALRFGPAEYFDFLAAVRGRSWYVLNLVGFDASQPGPERSAEAMAESNARLARLRVDADRSAGPHLYQLGNELDRNRYAWSAERYVERSRATMTAVRAVDPAARFVAFLRDFDLDPSRTRGPRRGIDHAAEVLAGLPEVDDVSLQVYYDEAADEGERYDLGWRWRLLDRFLAELPARAGRPLNVWVTEHARARDLRARGQSRRLRLATTSGITGAVASADFCLAALQRPVIQATFWHALGGGVWWDLFEPDTNPVRPTPALRVFKLLRENAIGAVLETRTLAQTRPAYAGGYDVRSVVLRGTSPVPHHTVLAANRTTEPATLDVRIPGLSDQTLRAETSSVSAKAPGGDLSTELEVVSRSGVIERQRAGPDGRLTITLPALGVSAVRLMPADAPIR